MSTGWGGPHPEVVFLLFVGYAYFSTEGFGHEAASFIQTALTGCLAVTSE